MSVWRSHDCGVTFRSQTDLHEHQQQDHLSLSSISASASSVAPAAGAGHHSRSAPIPCSECGKMLRNSSALKSHLKYSHHLPSQQDATETSFQNHHSVKTSKNNNSRNNSKSSASAVNNSCSECGKIFKRKQDLKSHMRVHTGEKPYQCKVCLKAFGLASNFSKHRRTHSEAENQAAGNYYNVGLGNRKKVYRPPPSPPPPPLPPPTHHHHQQQVVPYDPRILQVEPNYQAFDRASRLT